jgi:hypothetical protein
LKIGGVDRAKFREKRRRQMSGSKTHQQFLRGVERKTKLHNPDTLNVRHPDESARQSEFAVSEHGMNQESEHNKHNHPPKGAPKH